MGPRASATERSKSKARRGSPRWSIVAVCVAIGLAGAAMGGLLDRTRYQLAGVAEVANIRSDLSALGTLLDRLDSGHSDALASAQDFIVDFRDELGGVEDEYPVLADDASYIDGLVGAYDVAFAGWRAGDPSQRASLDNLDALATRTDEYLQRTGTKMQRAADQFYVLASTMVLVCTSLAIVFTRLGLRRMRRTRESLRIVELREESDRRISALIEHAPDVVVLIDRRGERLTYASPSVGRVLGFSNDEALSLSIPELLHPDDSESMLAAFREALSPSSPGVQVRGRIRHRDGTWRLFEMSISSAHGDRNLDGIVLNGRDITERVELERSLSHQAKHDPLTGLSNRASFVELLHRAIETRRPDQALSVIFLDLDGFKEVNDSLGHGAGDEVLMTIAARLVTLTRQRDHVARLGGDEFAIALLDDDPVPLAERLVEVVSQPIELSTGPVQVGGSVGLATAENATNVEDLLRCADVAMYDAKARGKNRMSTFAPHMHDALLERLAIRAALDDALANDEFRLVYQPEIGLRTGAMLGFEALIRWHRSDGTIVPPNDFIPVAETSGQIVEIGRWVLRTALTQLAAWQREFDDLELIMAVNVSARQLDEATFVGIVASELERAGVAPRTLTLELTETTLIRDLELATLRLDALHELGVRIAIDDYGTGNASIGYLRDFPVDIVKIDRSFVAALDDHPDEATAYLRSITDLARALSIDTVAEGIERVEQLESLRALGCPIGQGYHLARPLDAGAAQAFLVAHAAQPVDPALS